MGVGSVFNLYTKSERDLGRGVSVSDFGWIKITDSRRKLLWYLWRCKCLGEVIKKGKKSLKVRVWGLFYGFRGTSSWLRGRGATTLESKNQRFVVQKSIAMVFWWE